MVPDLLSKLSPIDDQALRAIHYGTCLHSFWYLFLLFHCTLLLS